MKKKIILSFFIAVLLCLPLILTFFPSLKGRELTFFPYRELTLKDFTWNNWFNDSFQSNAELKIKGNIGLCNSWIRLNNELNFRLFRQTNAQKLILGKQDFFYEEIYIYEYLGRNYIGQDLIQKKVTAFKRLQELLHNQYDIDLLFIFEPGKAYFSPEQIPDYYHPNIKSTSNYEGFINQFNKDNVHYLDLNGYFKLLKQNSPHLLYSKYGVHWTTYGLTIASDTIIKFIENECNINLSKMIITGDSSSTFSKDLDYDMEPPMNLLFDLPHEKLFFPIVNFISDSATDKPNVLTIADSYYWSFYDKKFSANLFNSNDFWYYNYSIYPNIFNPIDVVDDAKRKENILKHNLILLMSTDANLYDFGWRFIEQTLCLLDSTYTIDPEIEVFNEIMSQRDYYNALVLESIRYQIPFEIILKREIMNKMNNNGQ